MCDGAPLAGREQIPRIDTTIPQPARFWDYLLGGKDNYPVDHQVGEQVLAIFPDLRDAARADRGFLFRAVRQLYNSSGAAPIRTRTRQELTRFFDGLELLEPGVVSCSLWRPHPTDVGTQYCGVARKPPSEVRQASMSRYKVASRQRQASMSLSGQAVWQMSVGSLAAAHPTRRLGRGARGRRRRTSPSGPLPRALRGAGRGLQAGGPQRSEPGRGSEEDRAGER
ncbi:MAG: SAM-dependent methyltransferase [Pseudonocardiaceae bacterium]